MVVAGTALALPSASLPAVAKVEAADVAQLEGVALNLWTTTHHRGAGAYQDVLDVLAHVQTVIERATYGESVGLGLQRVAGHLQYLAGWTAYDEVQPDLAWQHLNEAFRISRTADDDRLAVLVLAEMSLEASSRGTGREGVELAQTAGRIARGFITPGIRSRLTAREALGLGHTGDTATAQAALARAERLLDEGDMALDDGSWLDRNHWDAGGLQNAIGETHFALGLPVAAERASRSSLDACRPDWPRSKASFAARVAAAQLAAGGVDEGAASISYSLLLLDGIRSPQTIVELGQLRPVLEGHESVRGVPEALNALALAPA
jgi:hypothetical protein